MFNSHVFGPKPDVFLWSVTAEARQRSWTCEELHGVSLSETVKRPQ